MSIVSILLTVLAMTLSSGANAEIIKFDFTATITSAPDDYLSDKISPHLLGGIPIGETIKGSVIYSTNVSNSRDLFPFQFTSNSEFADYYYREYRYTEGEFRITYNTSVGSFDTGSKSTGRITVVNDMPRFACCDDSVVTGYSDHVTYQATSSEIYDNGSSGMYSLIHGDFRLYSNSSIAPDRPNVLTSDQLPYAVSSGDWDNMMISIAEYRSLLNEEGVMYSHDIYRYWATVDSVSIGTAQSSVPEPNTLLLICIGLTVTTLQARRRRITR